MSNFLSATRHTVPSLLLLGIAAAVLGCAPKEVSRISPASVTDLSGRWNDTDSRLVANKLIASALSARWAERYMSTHGGERPVVIVGDFRNRTMEHIPVSTFVNDLEQAFIRSGSVRVVASGEQREDIRAERHDQQAHARTGTRARLAYELGADYMLVGTIQSIQDEADDEKIIFYQVDARLIDLESNAQIWAGQKQIKKYVERNRFSL